MGYSFGLYTNKVMVHILQDAEDLVGDTRYIQYIEPVIALFFLKLLHLVFSNISGEKDCISGWNWS